MLRSTGWVVGGESRLALQTFLGMLIELHPKAESSFSSSGVIQPLSILSPPLTNSPLPKMPVPQQANSISAPLVSNTGFGFRPGEKAGNSLAASLEDHHLPGLRPNAVSHPVGVC